MKKGVLEIAEGPFAGDGGQIRPERSASAMNFVAASTVAFVPEVRRPGGSIAGNFTFGGGNRQGVYIGEQRGLIGFGEMEGGHAGLGNPFTYDAADVASGTMSAAHEAGRAFAASRVCAMAGGAVSFELLSAGVERLRVVQKRRGQATGKAGKETSGHNTAVSSIRRPSAKRETLK